LPPRTADAAPDDVAAIDALLPQTQCTRCGFAGCRPYAQAIAAGQAAINRCPPGGTAGIAALARLLGRDELPPDPSCGSLDDPGIARIDADECIGCARCLPACPVDAIIGAHRLLHTVLTAACTGCELCIQACPVDCIRMQPRSAAEPAPTPPQNRDRYQTHCARAEREARDQAQLLAERKRAAQAVNARVR
jgi:electron transport complex protein RnfB